MATSPNVCLKLSSRAENVLLVRETLTGVAEAIGLDETDLGDIKTAVTEACNNVVQHAYGDGEGPLEIELYVSADAVEVIVRDHGVGIRPRVPGGHNGASGIGAPVMQALAQRVQYSKGADGGGTEVRMEFTTSGPRTLESLPVTESLELSSYTRTGLADRAGLADTMGVAIAPARWAQAVLPRLVCVLAARAHFSTDRISDAQLVADALIAQTPESLEGSHLRIGIAVQPRNIELCLGPLRTDRTGWRLVDSKVAGLSPVVEKLTNRREVIAVDSAEALALHLSDRG